MNDGSHAGAAGPVAADPFLVSARADLSQLGHAPSRSSRARRALRRRVLPSLAPPPCCRAVLAVPLAAAAQRICNSHGYGYSGYYWLHLVRRPVACRAAARMRGHCARAHYVALRAHHLFPVLTMAFAAVCRAVGRMR